MKRNIKLTTLLLVIKRSVHCKIWIKKKTVRNPCNENSFIFSFCKLSTSSSFFSLIAFFSAVVCAASDFNSTQFFFCQNVFLNDTKSGIRLFRFCDRISMRWRISCAKGVHGSCDQKIVSTMFAEVDIYDLTIHFFIGVFISETEIKKQREKKNCKFIWSNDDLSARRVQWPFWCRHSLMSVWR